MRETAALISELQTQVNVLSGMDELKALLQQEERWLRETERTVAEVRRNTLDLLRVSIHAPARGRDQDARVCSRNVGRFWKSEASGKASGVYEGRSRSHSQLNRLAVVSLDGGSASGLSPCSRSGDLSRGLWESSKPVRRP